MIESSDIPDDAVLGLNALVLLVMRTPFSASFVWWHCRISTRNVRSSDGVRGIELRAGPRSWFPYWTPVGVVVDSELFDELRKTL